MNDAIVGISAFGIILCLYFVPTFTAAMRRHRSVMAIIVVNLVLGWTFIGWFFALIWSLTGNTERKGD